MEKKNREWTEQELQLLESIKRRHRQKKWKLISKDFAKKGLKRTEHQCRHKWVNCINPEINHGRWSDEELEILYRQYQNYHSQWSIIQKFLPGRTQIKIKNHFYGVLRNIARTVLKYFKQIPGKQSQISNRINPNELQLIYNGLKQFLFLSSEIKQTIISMHYRFNKPQLIKIIQDKIDMFKRFNALLLSRAQIDCRQLSNQIDVDYQRQNQKNDRRNHVLSSLQPDRSATSKPQNQQELPKIPQIQAQDAQNTKNCCYQPEFFQMAFNNLTQQKLIFPLSLPVNNFFQNVSTVIPTSTLYFMPFSQPKLQNNFFYFQGNF